MEQLRFMDDGTDDELGDASATDRLLPSSQSHPATSPPQQGDTTQPSPPSTSGDSQSSFSTAVMMEMDRKMGGQGDSNGIVEEPGVTAEMNGTAGSKERLGDEAISGTETTSIPAAKTVSRSTASEAAENYRSVS